MPLSDKDLARLLVFLKKTQPDPPAPFLKLTVQQEKELAGIQAKFNAKIDAIQTEKMNAILNVLGMAQ